MSYETMLSEYKSWMENTKHVPEVNFNKFVQFGNWARGVKVSWTVGIDVYRMLFVNSQDNDDFEYTGEHLMYKGVPIILDPKAEPHKITVTTK
jgi:hypothetical protein